MEMPATLSSRSDQIQALGNILHLVEQLDIEDIATVTSGSRLGRVVDLLAQVKQALSPDSGLGNAIGSNDRRKQGMNGANSAVTNNATNAVENGAEMAIANHTNHDFELVESGEAGAMRQAGKSAKSAPKKTNRNGLAPSTRKAKTSQTLAAKPKPGKRKSSQTATRSGKKANSVSHKRSPKSSHTKRSSDPKRIMISYLKQVFADVEVFPDRNSITDFFERHFQIEFQIDKESRPELVSRLCRMAIAKQVSRNELGDILLADTNSKYGAFLKQDEVTFLQGWQSGLL
jgi:hypothetical protein